MIKILFFLLSAWACVTSSNQVPDWKQYARDQGSLNSLNVTAQGTLNCVKQLPSKGKIEGQRFSVTLSRTGASFFKIGMTEDRPLRYFGVLQGQEYWGELADYEMAVRVGAKSLTQVTLTLYNQGGDITHTIEFTDCRLT